MTSIQFHEHVAKVRSSIEVKQQHLFPSHLPWGLVYI